MIDYDKTDDDPVVAEVRRVREELAARFNYDLRAIFEDARRRAALGERQYVTLPPRRPKGWGETAKKAG
jgi:hypothetical protein